MILMHKHSPIVAEPRFPVGTQFQPRGKDYTCTIRDFHVTINQAGEIVRKRYVVTHRMAGQIVTDSNVVETTIAMALQS